LTIESHDQDRKNTLVNQFARDGDAEKRFGARDVIGRRCGFHARAKHWELHMADGGGDAEKQTHQPSGLLVS
jgi:hypothetical protein